VVATALVHQRRSADRAAQNEAIEQEDTFSNYKKFSSTFTILPGVKEVPPEEKQK